MNPFGPRTPILRKTGKRKKRYSRRWGVFRFGPLKSATPPPGEASFGLLRKVDSDFMVKSERRSTFAISVFFAFPGFSQGRCARSKIESAYIHGLQGFNFVALLSSYTLDGPGVRNISASRVAFWRTAFFKGRSTTSPKVGRSTSKKIAL